MVLKNGFKKWFKIMVLKNGLKLLFKIKTSPGHIWTTLYLRFFPSAFAQELRKESTTPVQQAWDSATSDGQIFVEFHIRTFTKIYVKTVTSDSIIEQVNRF